jgi:hypothetical protein
MDPLAMGGDLLSDTVRPAHRSCNSRHGARMGNALRAYVKRPPSWPEKPTVAPKVEPTFEGLEEAEDVAVCCHCGEPFGGKARGSRSAVIDASGNLAHKGCASTLRT